MTVVITTWMVTWKTAYFNNGAIETLWGHFTLHFEELMNKISTSKA